MCPDKTDSNKIVHLRKLALKLKHQNVLCKLP